MRFILKNIVFTFVEPNTDVSNSINPGQTRMIKLNSGITLALSVFRWWGQNVPHVRKEHIIYWEERGMWAWQLKILYLNSLLSRQANVIKPGTKLDWSVGDLRKSFIFHSLCSRLESKREKVGGLLPFICEDFSSLSFSFFYPRMFYP